MKNTLKNTLAWQKKRNELPVEGDPSMDWLQMRSALDKAMPSSGKIKNPYRPKGINWLYKLFIVAAAAGVVYGLVQLYLSKKQHAPVKAIPQKTKQLSPGLPVRDIVPFNPATNTGKQSELKPMGKPVINAVNDSVFKYNKAKNLITQQTINSKTKQPDTALNQKAKYNSAPHRDSLLLPVTSSPPITVHDSAANKIHTPAIPNSFNKKDTLKAGSGNAKNGKKKKRSKLQVFF